MLEYSPAIRQIPINPTYTVRVGVLSPFPTCSLSRVYENNNFDFSRMSMRRHGIMAVGLCESSTGHESQRQVCAFVNVK